VSGEACRAAIGEEPNRRTAGQPPDDTQMVGDGMAGSARDRNQGDPSESKRRSWPKESMARRTGRRAWIDKPGSKEKRLLGIPAVRDRIVQGALRHVLEPIFETDFAGHSYGFRLGRVDALFNQLGVATGVIGQGVGLAGQIQLQGSLGNVETDMEDGWIVLTHTCRNTSPAGGRPAPSSCSADAEQGRWKTTYKGRPKTSVVPTGLQSISPHDPGLKRRAILTLSLAPGQGALRA